MKPTESPHFVRLFIGKPFRGCLMTRAGQGMVEYLVLIALIALGGLFVIRLFGKDVKQVIERTGYAIQQESLDGESHIKESDLHDPTLADWYLQQSGNRPTPRGPARESAM